MSATTQQGVSSTAPKPVLHGVRIKTRKSVQKAQAKFEPVAFRDDLIKVLIEAKPGDFDDIATKLDLAGNKLDYRRYVETLFEILLTGGVLAPGGTFIQDETAHSPFSFFTAEDNAESIRAHVEVLNKLIRRYKYLQRGFEDTIKNILQYINKFNAAEQSKLAMALGIFMSNSLAPVNVLTVLFKEHLVKDGLSLQFVTGVFRSYLTESSIDSLGSALKKSGMDSKLLDFFPVNKRDSECFARHFEAEDMKALVEYQNKKAKTHLKDNIVDELRENLVGEENPKTIPEIIAQLKSQMKENNLPEAEFVCLVWDGIVGSVEWSSRPETVENQALRTVNIYGNLLNAFCTNPKSELALLQKIQLTCYVDAKLMKSFHIILKNLYKQDVISDSAIIYWYEKGSKSNGKAVFVKQTEAFVTWLKEQEEESSEEEED